MTGEPITSNVKAPREAPGRQQSLALALLVIVMAQLMVMLDATIVTTALSRMEHALGFSGTSLQWIVTGYAITFGGFILLGGRAGDRLGRKKVFIVGLVLFSAASLAGGLAQDGGTLIAMRAVQGVGAAMIAPTALALITTTFPPGKQLNRAMGVYAATAGSGAAVGLVAGGLLTTYVSWRWVFIVNVPIGLITAALAARALPDTAASNRDRLDIAGAVTGTLGIAALVYGLSEAPPGAQGPAHWGDANVAGALAAAVVLIAAFIVIEHRSARPLLPLRLLTHRTRAGSYLTMLCLMTGMAGTFFFMTLFLQNVLGYSPIEAGLAFLPFATVMVVVSEVVSRIVGRTGPRVLMLAGVALVAGGTLWYAQISENSGYASGLLGPMLLNAIGLGLAFVPMTLTGTAEVDPADAGVAASLLNTGQQVGMAIGLASLGTVVWTVYSNAIHQAGGTAAGSLSSAVVRHSLVSGFSRGFLIAVAIMVLALIAVATMVCPSGGQPREAEVDPVGCLNLHWRRPRAGVGARTLEQRTPELSGNS